MRATVLQLAFFALAVTAGFAVRASDSDDNPAKVASAPVYYLRGYYKLDSQRPVWQESDSSPWSAVKADSPWVNRRLVKWGYLPFTHDSKNYYCLIDDKPRTGSHVTNTTFICGDTHVVESIFLQYNHRPSLPMTGGGAPLEDSLRPRPPSGN